MKVTNFALVVATSTRVLLGCNTAAASVVVVDSAQEEQQQDVGVANEKDFVSKKNTPRQLGSKSPKGMKSAKGKRKNSKTGRKEPDTSENNRVEECDLNYCGAEPIALGALKTCLTGSFDHGSSLYFPYDEDYDLHRMTAFSYSRFPAAIVFAEDVEDVQTALACAVDNGYKVSARGGNHSYQGLGTMDGYVVIDMGRTCKPEDFVVDKDDQGPHIIEGSKYIGTIKAQAGCTNAIMLAHGHKHFGDQDGMTLIGSCPSVGITGFNLGGGGGDVSPYVGYGVDIVKEFQLVLYDGTIVKASEEENPELYWATRGGGGGNGVVTHLTYKIVQAPKQKYEDAGGKKFTWMRIAFNIKDLEKGAALIQEWFYDADPKITGKFGGGFGWDHGASYATFVYLGSWKEAIEDLKETGLLDHELFEFSPVPYASPPPRVGGAILTENYEVICQTFGPCPEIEDIPGATVSAEGSQVPAFSMFQFDSYAEVEAFQICVGRLYFFEDWSSTSGDFCKDLGLDDDKCEDGKLFFFGISADTLTSKIPKLCTDKDVIDAMLNAAGDPSGFMNSHGPSVQIFEQLAQLVVPALPVKEVIQWWMDTRSQDRGPGSAGASMFQRFDGSFFAKMLSETAQYSNHLQHGAALMVDPDETAYPWRNAAFMVEYETGDIADSFLERIVDGGYTPQGYYAYLNPSGMKKWRSYFFDDKWRILSEIRAKYDPKDVFGKPLTIESIGE
uniref:FAD-binding PCMH-type domain-containing protein n=2 Tax=Ditylum brightwellii TaxID=49249 RepID=A0A7S4QZ26_9STRA